MRTEMVACTYSVQVTQVEVMPEVRTRTKRNWAISSAAIIVMER